MSIRKRVDRLERALLPGAAGSYTAAEFQAAHERFEEMMREGRHVLFAPSARPPGPLIIELTSGPDWLHIVGKSGAMISLPDNGRD